MTGTAAILRLMPRTGDGLCRGKLSDVIIGITGGLFKHLRQLFDQGDRMRWPAVWPSGISFKAAVIWFRTSSTHNPASYPTR